MKSPPAMTSEEIATANKLIKELPKSYREYMGTDVDDWDQTVLMETLKKVRREAWGGKVFPRSVLVFLLTVAELKIERIEALWDEDLDRIEKMKEHVDNAICALEECNAERGSGVVD